MPSSSNKIALFIDGANLYATAKTLGFDIDYKRLLKEFAVSKRHSVVSGGRKLHRHHVGSARRLAEPIAALLDGLPI